MSEEVPVAPDQPDPPYVDPGLDEPDPDHDPELRPPATDDVKVPSGDRVPQRDA